MRPKILISEAADYSHKALETYQSFGDVFESPNADDSIVRNHLSTADILVVRLGKMLDERWLNDARRIKCIVSPTTGLNHIDISYSDRKQIRVISLKGETQFLETIPSTAEFTMSLMFASARNLIAAANDVAEGNWQREKWKGHNIQGKTIGIIGLGRVGTQVAQMAKALGMFVIAFDTKTILKVPYEVMMYDQVQEVLSKADIISIHIPSFENYHYLSAALLNHCKQGAILINTSRGDVWEEDAVTNLVLSGHLSGVATDVLESELMENWQDNSPLAKAAAQCNRIIITPHIGGATYESMHATEEFVAEKCKEWWSALEVS